MSARAPLLIWLGLALAVLYWAVDGHIPVAAAPWLKASAVSAFALYAARGVRGGDGRLLAAVLGFDALGDLLLEWSMVAGPLAFIIGHITAILLYLRHRRRGAVSPALVLVPLSMAGAWLLTRKPEITLYAGFVGAMTATALASQFPRARTGLGAVLFLASDMLIFARLGHRIAPDVTHLFIWPLYVIGQALIARGGVAALRDGPDLLGTPA